MKRIIFLSLIFSVQCASAMHDKSICVENNSNHTISIVYKDPACCILEKLQPHTRLSLLSSTPFLVIAYQNERHRIAIENARNHFVIESKKDNDLNRLIILEYNDRYIMRSKKDSVEIKLGICPSIFE